MLFQRLSLPVLFKGTPSSSIHQFTVTTLAGKPFDFASLKNKKILLVNTASQCGLTSQYKGLQHLFEQYRDKGLMIVGFPSNDFGKQEPGNNEEIEAFCEINFGVTFLMMEKVAVKGVNTHPVFHWLTHKSANGVMNSRVKWNFQKYLVDENGHLVDMVLPWRQPDCPKILRWLNKV